MGKKILKSLGNSTAIHIFVVSACIAVLASVIQIYIEYRKDVDRVKSRFELIESSYIPAVAAALWQIDEDQARLILAGIKSLPDVAYVEIKANDSDFTSSLGEKSGSRYLTREVEVAFTNQDHSAIAIGTLTISLSLDAVISRTYGLSLNILITNILKTLLLAVYVIFLLRKRITRHLIHIVRYLESKDQSQPLKLERRSAREDELDVMVQSINNKNNEILDKIQTIEKHKVELEHTVEEKTQALTRTAETKATLLRVLCHDLSNPLVLITGLLELFANNRISEEKKQAKYKTLSRAAQLMADILSNVREMEAVDSGKRNITIAPVNLERMFDDLNLIFRDRLTEKQICLEIENQLPDGIGVFADPVSLSNHVFNNLVSNALKFSFPGSKVRIVAQVEDELVHVSIIDAGVGMSEEIAQAIFDPTRQTTRPGTAGEKGTGFGMPIVKSFVEKYGGRIQVESTSAEINPSEHGTTFHLYLKKARLVPDLAVAERSAG
ncbi:ATP-binding protein [Oligoflexus tunisiensis]|uniref:ATP-binding protein n=1 Tax=Oligoflexus tunisiensis TaxID=708132 RepID=UPI00159F1C57|nr:ATP-binding protein [Oligoflexus tunisiensis]